MEIFSALLANCAGNSPVTGEFPAQRPVTPSFDVFFDLRLDKRLSKQSWCWWFETLSRPLWRHCNIRVSISVTGTHAISVSKVTVNTVIDILYIWNTSSTTWVNEYEWSPWSLVEMDSIAWHENMVFLNMSTQMKKGYTNIWYSIMTNKLYK